MSDAEANVLKAIIDALKPLTSEERQRTLEAALVFLGEEPNASLAARTAKDETAGVATSPSKYESHCTNRKHGKNERRQKIITNMVVLLTRNPSTDQTFRAVNFRPRSRVGYRQAPPERSVHMPETRTPNSDFSRAFGDAKIRP